MLTCKSKLRYLIFILYKCKSRKHYVYFHSFLFLYDSYIFRFVELFQSLNFISFWFQYNIATLFRQRGKGSMARTPDVFLEIKCIGLKPIDFFYFSKTCPSLKAQIGAFITTTWMPYFTYTRLNLYLNLLQVIGFWLFIALWRRLEQKEADCVMYEKKFCFDFCIDVLKKNFYIFSFPWIQI